MKHLSRLLISLAFLLAAFPGAFAQDYPVRPVRIIVGFGPGSAADITSRVMAQQLTEKLGQQFVVEPRPGAGSNIAAAFVARAPADGYTLLMATIANTINATLSPNPGFDFPKDFAPIGLVAAVPNILVVNRALGVKSVAELVALARGKPGEILYGSSGAGSALHLSAELFNVKAGVKLAHVPYPGSAQAVTDLLAGRIAVMFSPASSVLPHVDSGELTALAVTHPTRIEIAPTIPTMTEAGFSGFETGVWFGLLAPAGTPREVIGRLSGALAAAMSSREAVAPLRAQGIDPLMGGPDELSRHIASEISKWAEAARSAGLVK